ncbi:MAG: flagellar basal body rod protein FlgB [Gammaproteobacteria bacterium]|nr:flagellar basal body rod protein FlgB [Gammaproteobacteria bacterium]
MPINFDKAFGIHDNALLLFERRTQLLTSNIANSDTPEYKARDIDFNSILQNVQSDQLHIQKTNKNHISLSDDSMGDEIKYRIPEQSSADGNTVDMQKEKAEFAENSIRYQATLHILSRRIDGIKKAFKGE